MMRSDADNTSVGRLRVAMLVFLLAVWSPVQAARSPIKVGVTVAVTGPYAVPGSAELEGIRLWVHDINQRGGLLGRPVELVHYDDGSDPQTSTRLYQRLISEDRVDLLLGPYGTDITMAASRVAEQHNLPMVATGAAGEDVWARGFRNIFGVDALAENYADLLIAAAAGAGLQTLALVYADSSFPRQMARGARRAAARHGLRIVYDRAYRPQQVDYDAVIDALGVTHPDLVIGGTYLEDSVGLVRAASRAAFAPCAMAFTVGPALRPFIDQLGPQAEGIFGLVSWMRSAALPMAMDFSYRYKRLYGHNAGVQAALGYGAGQVLEAAVRLAGALDRDAVRTQLRDMKFQSLLGRYQVDETGKQVGKPTYVLQIQQGNRLLVLPEALQESPVRYSSSCHARSPATR